MRLRAKSRVLHLGLLRCASALVPARERSEWWREWRGELWHVEQACAPLDGPAEQGGGAVTAFCLGAFKDALCLRQAGRKPGRLFGQFDGAPAQCALVLVALLAAGYAAALLLPGVRAERSLSQRKVNPNLVLIEQEGSNAGSMPTISPAQFRSWERRTQRYFDGFAFYRVTRMAVDEELPAGETQGTAGWGVARASTNLFKLLGMTLRFGATETSAGDGMPEVILSEALWKREFGADQRVAGSEVRLDGQTVRIVGVAPDASLGLPGSVDAWVLDADADRGANGSGYVVAHLTPAGAAEMWTSRALIGANGPDGMEGDLLAVSLEDWRPSPQGLYLFGLLLAMLALPAITSVSLGEASVNPQRISWTRRLCRWSFLCGKMALLLPIVYFVALDLAFGATGLGREGAAYIQLACTFALCLFGMRWVLKDQRQRCPVCMHCVTHPAHVGQASRTFLDWNGTEMMCMGGHTLLHVPSLPTSWFGAQRWLYLDTSWEFLFAGSPRPGA